MRSVVELAVATGISPRELVQLDADTLATLVDVITSRK